MVGSATNILSPNALPSSSSAGQGVFDQANPTEQPRVRANPSERRSCAAIAKKFAEKISAFFKEIASCFLSWKESPVDATLEEAAKKAASTINDGLVTNDFTKVYKGLKRLYNAEQKFPNEDKDKNVSTRVKAAIAAASGEAEKNLREFAEGRDTLVNQHSGRNTLFHQVLEGLEKIGLVRNSYIESFNTVDNEIKKSLQSIMLRFLHNQVCYGSDKAYKNLILHDHEYASIDQAIKGIENSVKDSGNLNDKYELSLCYMNDIDKYGYLDMKNYKNGYSLLKESADGGCLDAKYYLAYDKLVRYSKLKEKFPKNFMVETFKQLSNEGHIESQYQLAKLYTSSGENYEQGMKLIKQLAEIGHLPSKQKLDDLLTLGPKW